MTERRNLYIDLDEIAAAELIKTETPSYGVTYPEHIMVWLKSGIKLTIDYYDTGYKRLRDLLFGEQNKGEIHDSKE